MRYFFHIALIFSSVLFSCCSKTSGAQHNQSFILEEREIKNYSGLVSGFDLRFNVVMPPKNRLNPETPVFYFFHGTGGDENSDVFGFTNYIDTLLLDTNIVPILVFPNGGKSGLWGEDFDYFMSTIVPYIDKKYAHKIDSSKRKKISFGYSRGGVTAFRAPILYPNTFDLSVSISGGVWSRDKELFSHLEQGVKHGSVSHTMVIIAGDEDRPNAFANIEKYMLDHKLDFQRYLIRNQPHNLGIYYKNAVPIIQEHLLTLFSTHVRSEKTKKQSVTKQ